MSTTISNPDSGGRIGLGLAGIDICPDGWRVATSDDWMSLMDLVGEELPRTRMTIGDGNIDDNTIRFESAGQVLKAKNPYWDGGNTIGFTALPGGYYNGPEDGFFEKGEKAYFVFNMRVSDSDMRPGSGLNLGRPRPDRAVFLESLNDESQIKDVISSRDNFNAFSVRCVKIPDDENLEVIGERPRG